MDFKDKLIKIRSRQKKGNAFQLRKNTVEGEKHMSFTSFGYLAGN